MTVRLDTSLVRLPLALADCRDLPVSEEHSWHSVKVERRFTARHIDCRPGPSCAATSQLWLVGALASSVNVMQGRPQICEPDSSAIRS